MAWINNYRTPLLCEDAIAEIAHPSRLQLLRVGDRAAVECENRLQFMFCES